jgi:hypothetical protein
VKKWLKENWNWKTDWMLIAFGAAIAAGIVIALVDKTPPKDASSQYLLSTIPQVIGTVFVLTVAIMQAVGGSEGLPLKKLFGRPEFWVGAFVSFIGIALPLIILYTEAFAEWSAFCLFLGIGNLFVIGWFIFRIAPLQATTKRLAKFKKDAQEAISQDVSSDVLEIIPEVTNIGLEAIGTQKWAIITDACKILKEIGIPQTGTPKYVSFFKGTADGLIRIDKEARKRNIFNISETYLIMYLIDILVGFMDNCKKDHRFDEVLDNVKEYLLECHRVDLQAQRFNFEKSYDPKNRNYLWALKRLLGVELGHKRWDKFEELRDSILEEFKKPLRSGKLPAEYASHAYALIFNIFIEELFKNPRLSEGSEERNDYLEKLDKVSEDFAKAASISLKELLDQETKRLINIGSYKIIGVAPDFVNPQFDELKKRLGVTNAE